MHVKYVLVRARDLRIVIMVRGRRGVMMEMELAIELAVEDRWSTRHAWLPGAATGYAIERRSNRVWSLVGDLPAAIQCGVCETQSTRVL